MVKGTEVNKPSTFGCYSCGWKVITEAILVLSLGIALVTFLLSCSQRQ